MSAMQEDFFADTALVGIATALPAYRFCWLLNKQFNIDFIREPELDVCLQIVPEKSTYFPIYQYALPLSGNKYLLYKLKNDKESLLPEAKQLDYLWLLQSNAPETDAQEIVQHLRNVPEIQLAQLLVPEKLKSLNHLLV